MYDLMYGGARRRALPRLCLEMQLELIARLGLAQAHHLMGAIWDTGADACMVCLECSMLRRVKRNAPGPARGTNSESHDVSGWVDR